MISDGARRHAASARSSGFVLVGVVWFLAIMTLLASAAVLWVGRSLDATENRRKALLRELEEHALLARVQWLVATQRYTVAGLSVPGNAGAAPSKVDMDTSILPIGGELPLDGREFCMANGWCVALLDRSARLSLSGIDPRVLSRLLLGVPAEQVQVMVAQWFSYLYPGAAPRLGSAAQASDRSSPGQARRRPLRSVMEVFRLEAWRPWEAHLLDAGWRDLVAADEAALNINTADARILPGDYRRTLSADCCKPAGSVRSPGCRTCMTSSGVMRGWFPRMAGRAWPVRSCRFGSTRQEPSRGRNTRSASTQSTACCHPGSFSRRGP